MLKAEGWYGAKTTVYHIEFRVRRLRAKGHPENVRTADLSTSVRFRRRYRFRGRHCNRDSMKRTSGANSLGMSPNGKVIRRDPSEVVTMIEIVPLSGAERSETGSGAWRKLQPSSNRSISATSLGEALAASKDHAFGTGTCSPV